jgi:hypothetical protein
MPESDSDRGKCATCGFLCAYPPNLADSANPIRTELSEHARTTGKLGKLVLLGEGRHPAFPVCIRGVANLNAEIKADKDRPEGAPEDRDDATKRVLWNSRGCTQWREHTPGIGPQQLLDVVKFEELETRLEERRRVWASHFEDERRKWTERFDDSRREFETKLNDRAIAEQRKSGSTATKFTIAAIVLALAQIVVALAAMTPDAILARWLGLGHSARTTAIAPETRSDPAPVLPAPSVSLSHDDH